MNTTLPCPWVHGDPDAAAADVNEPEGVLVSRQCRLVLDLGRIREDALNRRPSAKFPGAAGEFSRSARSLLMRRNR